MWRGGHRRNISRAVRELYCRPDTAAVVANDQCGRRRHHGVQHLGGAFVRSAELAHQHGGAPERAPLSGGENCHLRLIGLPARKCPHLIFVISLRIYQAG